MTISEMRAIVRSITYKPGWAINFYSDCERPYVQLYVTETVAAMDSHTRTHAPWKSAKRYLSPHMCRQEIVGAVFGLIRDAEEHETREWFRYRGASIYNPHLDPDVLVEVARKAESFNVRENAMTMEETPGHAHLSELVAAAKDAVEKMAAEQLNDMMDHQRASWARQMKD